MESWGPKEAAAAQIQSLQQEVFGLVAVAFTLIAFELALASYVATSNPPRSFSAPLAAGALFFADTLIVLIVLAVMARYDLIYFLIETEKPWSTPYSLTQRAPKGNRMRLARGWFSAENSVFYGISLADANSPAGFVHADYTSYRHFIILVVTAGILAGLALFILNRCAPYPVPW